MARHAHYPHAPRSPASRADARDLRAAITDALSAGGDDQGGLRRAVRTCVGRKRAAGTAPRRVIRTLTELLEGAAVAAGRRDPLRRQGILRCVQACCGHLGGDALRASRAVETRAEGAR